MYLKLFIVTSNTVHEILVTLSLVFIVYQIYHMYSYYYVPMYMYYCYVPLIPCTNDPTTLLLLLFPHLPMYVYVYLILLPCLPVSHVQLYLKHISCVSTGIINLELPQVQVCQWQSREAVRY